MTDKNSIEQDLLAYIADAAPLADRLRPESDLLETGALDSLLVVDLVVYIEAAFGVRLAPTDISPSHFRSVQRLADLVWAKQQESTKAA